MRLSALVARRSLCLALVAICGYASPEARGEWKTGLFSDGATYTDTNNWVGGVIDDTVGTGTIIKAGNPNMEVRFAWNFTRNHETGTNGMAFDYTMSNNVNLILASAGGVVRKLTLNGNFRSTVASGRFGTGGTGGLLLDLNGGHRTFTLVQGMRFEGGDVTNGALTFRTPYGALNASGYPRTETTEGILYIGAKSYTGITEVASGLFRLAAGGGAAPGSSEFVVRPDSMFQIGVVTHEPSTNRVGDTVPLRLCESSVDFRHGSTNSAGLEDIGPLVVDGFCRLYLGRNSGAVTDFTVTADRLERTERSIVRLISHIPAGSPTWGAYTNFTGDAVARLKFDAPPPAFGSGGGRGATNASVVPFACGLDAGFLSLVTYDATEGLRVLRLATEIATATNAAGFMALYADDNVRIGAVASMPTLTLTGDQTINALIIQNPNNGGSTIVNGPYRLTVGSGAVYLTGSYSDFLNVGVLDFGTNEGIIQAIAMRGDQRKEINAVIRGSGGLTVGLDQAPSASAATTAGRLWLGGANTYTGDTTVTRGSVLVVGNERLPDATVARLHAFASLEFYDKETLAGVAGDGTLKLFRSAAGCLLGTGTVATGAVTLAEGGTLAVRGTDSLQITNASLVVGGGTWTVGIADSNQAGRVIVSSNLAFQAGARLAVNLENGYAHGRTAASWDIASAPSISGLPAVSGYRVDVVSGSPEILRLTWFPPAGTVVMIH